MSGHKRKFVSISEEEYRRLHEAELKVRVISQTAQIRLDGINQESQAALWEAVRETRSRQEDFNAAVARLGREVQETEAHTGSLLMAYHQRLADSVQAALNNIYGQAEDQLNDQAFQFDQQAAFLRAESQHTAQALADWIEEESVGQEWKAEVASQWLQAALDVVALVRGEYCPDPERKAALDLMAADLETAAANLENGFYEASLSITQGCVSKASALRIELERQHSEKQVLQQAALARLRQSLVLIEELQFVRAVSLDGSFVPYEINVDYWTGGRLRQIRDQVERLALRLEHTPESFGKTGLELLLHGTLPEFQARLDEIVREARWNALNSQLRINIADLAIQALESQGFELTESGYSQEDVRLGYSALVRDYAGTEVRISVEPLEGKAVENELHIESSDAELRTGHELQRRDLEISQALEGFGLQVMGLRLQEPARGQPQGRQTARPLPQTQIPVKKGPSPV